MKIFITLTLLLLSNYCIADIEITPIHQISDIPTTTPTSGHYRLHLIDVGTGLSILIQGFDWNLLYDAGSSDDSAGNIASGSNSRTVAYLYRALGPSGNDRCRPMNDGWPTRTSTEQLSLTHVFQSHPHDDHGVMLDDVLECYQVQHVWDSGRINDRVFYNRFLQGVRDENEVTFHTAIAAPGNRTFNFSVGGNDIVIPASTNWLQFAEGEEVELDGSASFTILHADGTNHADPNDNSIVVRMDLGHVSVLLTGDAESGPRVLPDGAIGAVEEELVDRHVSLLDVDILQVGHHGSLTSSRAEFIEAVTPSIALISGGPRVFGGNIVLPDQEIVDFLEFNGILILRTNVFDGACPTTDRVGRETNAVGGCSSYLLEW